MSDVNKIQLKNYIANNENLKKTLKEDRDSYCTKAAKMERRSELADEINYNGDLTSVITRFIIGKNTYYKIAKHQYSKGFAERSGLNLYELLDETQDEAIDKKAENVIFYTSAKVHGSIGAIICASFVGLTFTLSGSIPLIIGSIAAGAVVGGIIGGVVGAVRGYFEEYQTEDLRGNSRHNGEQKAAALEKEIDNHLNMQELKDQLSHLKQRVAVTEQNKSQEKEVAAIPNLP
ncbi:MAG: hypothetical protein ACO2XZ_01395 [Rickettsiales bacterium]